MHTLRNRIMFFGSAAAVGFALLGLQKYMLANCFDHKGLLITGNLPMKLIWVLSIGFAVFLGALVTTIGGEGSYEDNFPRCTLSGSLMIGAGAVLALSASGLGLEPEPAVVLTPWAEMVYRVFGVFLRVLPWLAAGSMVVLGLYRMTGRKPPCFFSGIVCLFHMMMLVSNYRMWSADPKFYVYAFPMLSGALLMLCSFHRTCCDGGIIQRKKLLFTGLSAAACSAASLAGGFLTGFFLSGGLWAAGCMCNPAVLPPDPEEEEESTEASESVDE